MMNRNELTEEQINTVIGGANYIIKWDKDSQEYFIYDQSGNRVFADEQLITGHALDAFIESHPEDKFAKVRTHKLKLNKKITAR